MKKEEGASEAQMYVATTGGSPVLGKLAIAGGLQCPSGLVCQPAGGEPGNTTLVENGALRCAPPKGTP